MKAFMRKHLDCLRPADQPSVEALDKIKQDELVQVEVKRPRNIQHHRLFWVLMSTVHKHMPEDKAALYPRVENLVDAVKMQVGLREQIHMPSGKIHFKPGSIAFANMDQDAFSAFFNQVADLVCKHWLPGVTSEELRAEVLQMTGAQY